MKSLSLKEQLKSKLSTAQVEDIRQYHLTHDDYSGLSVNSGSQFDYLQIGADYEALFSEAFDFYCEVPPKDDYYAQSFYGDGFDYTFYDFYYDYVTYEYEYTNGLFHYTTEIGKQFSDLPSDLDHQNKIPKAPMESLLTRISEYYSSFLEGELNGLASKSKQAGIISKERVNVIQHTIFDNNTDQDHFFDNICMFSEFWIRCPLDWDKASGRSLLEHLFVHYELPTFLTKCWYRECKQENLQWLLIYIGYAQGGSVKQIVKNFDWTVPSKKLWHLLLQAPTGLSPRNAICYCEIQRLNGNDYIYENINRYNASSINLLLGENKDKIAFWYGMVHWLVSNQIVRHEIRRVLGWAYHQFTEHQRTGDNFVMDGRSLEKVRAETAKYYYVRDAARRRRRRAARERRRLCAEELNRRAEQEYLYTPNSEELKTYQWDKSHFSWDVPKTKWRFVELSSSKELSDEGEAMDHCVASYDKSCFDGKIAIISLRYEGISKATIEINTKSHALIQTAGYCNQDVTSAEMKLIEKWLKHHV